MEPSPEYTDEAMFGSDRLFKVPPEDMHKPMHRHIGALTFSSRRTPDLGKGSGTLISPDLVLTAAHNIYNADTGEVHFNFRFYPGHCGLLGNGLEIDDFFLPGKYVLNRCVANDYALLKLKQRVETKDFLPLSKDAPIAKEAVITICGYPGSEYHRANLQGQFEVAQFGLSEAGRVLEVRDRVELLH